jgi:hypothetical protein
LHFFAVYFYYLKKKFKLQFSKKQDRRRKASTLTWCNLESFCGPQFDHFLIVTCFQYSVIVSVVTDHMYSTSRWPLNTRSYQILQCTTGGIFLTWNRQFLNATAVLSHQNSEVLLYVCSILATASLKWFETFFFILEFLHIQHHITYNVMSMTGGFWGCVTHQTQQLSFKDEMA